MTPNVKMTIRYKAGHSYDEEWQRVETFCPNCGKQEVWMETGPGDYYEGAGFLCVACEWGFTLPSESEADSAEDKQRFEYFRSAKETP